MILLVFFGFLYSLFILFFIYIILYLYCFIYSLFLLFFSPLFLFFLALSWKSAAVIFYPVLHPEGQDVIQRDLNKLKPLGKSGGLKSPSAGFYTCVRATTNINTGWG